MMYVACHLGGDGATDLKVHIHVSLCRDVLEVDGCVVLVLGLAQIEGKLIVDGEVIIATFVHRISEIMVLGVAFLTVVASNSFGCAKTIPSPAVMKNMSKFDKSSEDLQKEKVNKGS